jgi:cell division protein ZapA
VQVKINIRGRQYTVRGDETGEDIKQLAAEVDARMTEVANRTRSFDEYTVAMLTALNLASELAQLRSQVSNQLEGFDREIASIAAMLEAMLPGSSSSPGKADPGKNEKPGGDEKPDGDKKPDGDDK